jgi:hypothetical protein
MVKKRTEAKQVSVYISFLLLAFPVSLTESIFLCFQVNYFSAQRIITPYALPLFKEEGARQKSTYRQMVKDRKVRRLLID